MANQLSFPLTKLYLADGSSRSSHSNAAFFGLPWQKNTLVFDTLLKHMGTDEVVAVISHELGHWKLGHTAWLFGLSQASLNALSTRTTPVVVKVFAKPISGAFI